MWFLSNGLSKPFFETLLASFAQQVGAGRERRIVLVPDNAGWHGPKSLPAGLTRGVWPCRTGSRWCSCRRIARSCSQLSDYGRLWPLVDEPVANRHFATLADLDAVVAERCRRLDPATIRPHTRFHWWPRPVQPN